MSIGILSHLCALCWPGSFVVFSLNTLWISKYDFFLTHFGVVPWRREWQPTPVFLPGESCGQRSLAGYSPWDHKELDTIAQLTEDLGWLFFLHRGKGQAYRALAAPRLYLVWDSSRVIHILKSEFSIPPSKVKPKPWKIPLY